MLSKRAKEEWHNFSSYKNLVFGVFKSIFRLLEIFLQHLISMDSQPSDFEKRVRAYEESMRRYVEQHAEENNDYLFLENHELTIFGEQA
jgi:hypothetical protein